MAVPVVGGISDFYSGTITLYPQKTFTIGYANAPENGLYSAAVGSFGASVLVEAMAPMVITFDGGYSQNEPTDPEILAVTDPLLGSVEAYRYITVYKMTATAISIATSSYFATCYEEGTGYITEYDEFVVNWSLGFSGLKLVRNVESTQPSWRQPMHVTDFAAGDGWVAGEDFSVVATCNGRSVSCDLSEDYPEGYEFTDTMVVDSWQLDYSQAIIGALAEGETYVRTLVNNIDFTGMDEDVGQAVATGSGSSWALIPDTSAAMFEDFAGWTKPPIIYEYVPVAETFLSGDWNPIIQDGFTNGGYLLTELPSGSDTAHSWGGTSKKSTSSFSPSVSINWAIPNLLYNKDEGVIDEIPVEMTDSYISVYVPGVDTPTDGNPLRVLASLTREDVPIHHWRSGDSWETELIQSGSNNFIIEAGTTEPKSILKNLVSRYKERCERLPVVGVAKDWSYPWRFRSHPAGEGLVLPNDPSYAEDVYHWQNHSFLRLAFGFGAIPESSKTEGVYSLDLTLRLKYSVPDFIDPAYTCGEQRALNYSVDYQEGEATYSFTVTNTSATVVIDLLCPDEDFVPQLSIVESLEIDGFLNIGEDDISVELTDLSLVQDQGYDHTGRNVESEEFESTIILKRWEDYNYLTEWSGLNLFYDGNPYLLDVPLEPGKGSGEGGVGNISKLEHCPESEATGLLHTLRPLAILDIINYSTEGWNLTLNQTEIDNMLETSEGPLASPVISYVDNYIQEPGDIYGGIHCRSWNMARGIPYKCYFRKITCGSINGLLKEGNRRYSKETIASTARVQVYGEFSYKGEDDVAVTPSGYPSGITLLASAPLVDYVDYQGWLSIQAGFLPSSFSVSATISGNIKYTGLIWKDGDWEVYSTLDDAARKDADAVFTFSIRPRQWFTYIQQLDYLPDRLDYSQFQGIRLLSADDHLRVGSYKPRKQGIVTLHKYGTYKPEVTRRLIRLKSVTITHMPNGKLFVAGVSRTTGEITIGITDFSGRDWQTVASISGYSFPTTRHSIDGTNYLIARKNEDGMFVAFRIATTGTVTELGSIVVGSEVTPALLITPEAHLVVAIVETSDVLQFISKDAGRTWESF